MKNLTIATMKEALKMMSIKDTHEAEMMKAVTIFENGGRFIAKWNGSRVIKAGVAVKSSTRKAGYIAIVEAVIECIGEDRWNEIVEVVESIEEATIEADPIESKTKEEIEEINKQIAEEAMEEAKEWIEEAKEEQTMNTKKHMTKSEAIREIATLSSSTLARICGSTNYSIIDDCSSRLILAASSMADDAFCDCENWIDVLHCIAISKYNDVDNYYLLGNMDYREYVIKYGYDKAVTILNDYIEIILEGSAETKAEQDYIRGAKDALCIA